MKVRFGDVVLDPEGMQLERDGELVPVEPQVLEVLAYLVEHRDRLVPKTELLDEIWGDRFVSESALSSRIKSARKAIGDNGRDQRLIRTVHGRGFRFVGDVEGDGTPATVATPPTERPADLTAVVLASLRAGRGLAAEVVSPTTSARAEVVDDVVFAAAAEGFLVGRGGGAGERRPFGTVVDGLDEWIQRRPELLDEMPVRCREELAAIIGGAPPSSASRLFVAAQELLTAAGRAGGAVLAVEDVHLIDRNTLDLLDHLARTARRVGVALVVTHRTGFALPGDLLHVEVGAEPAGPSSVPAGLRRTLARAAVVGDPLTRTVFRAATDLDAAGADRALDLAIAEGVLQRDGDGHHFRDGALATALADTLSTEERAEVVRAAVARMADDGIEPARLAQLLDEIGDVQAAAPHHLAAAWGAAMAGLHAEVLRHTAAVDRVDDDATRAGLLELRAEPSPPAAIPRRSVATARRCGWRRPSSCRG